MEYDISKFIGAAAADSDRAAPKPAYVHQDYPVMLYGPKGEEKKAKDAAGVDALLAKGFFRTPPQCEKDEDSAGPARAAEDRSKPSPKKNAK